MSAISVVIPTYNRLARLQRVLAALAQQTLDASEFEVIVVSDGCTDGTDEYLAGPTPVPVIHARQANAGPAAARNHGIELARGRIILFIDDDVLAAPALVQRHLEAHADTTSKVVIGPMLNSPDFAYTPWVAWEQAMLYKQYRAMRLGEYDATFRQFFTGNASVPRDLLLEAGCFDTSFRRAEDVELSYRLDKLGATFVFDETAAAYHLAERSFDSWLAAADAYGRNDITFARDHDQEWLLPVMAREFRHRSPLTQLLVRVCVTRPRLAALASSTLGAICRRKRPIPKISGPALSGLYGLTYYVGAAKEYGDLAEFKSKLFSASTVDSSSPRVAFVLEQTLGHVTHSQNLQSLVPRDERITPIFLPIPYEPTGRWSRVPGFSNWTVRAGIRARRSLREAHRANPVQALFVHTQVPSIFLGRWMRRIPTVVSLDATPVQIDELGAQYAHDRSGRAAEGFKWRLNRDAFARAEHIISWSEWSKQSLVEDYHVHPSKVTVLAPGVDLERWTRPAERRDDPSVVKILFVGGDLTRKGGTLLIDAVRSMRQASSNDETSPTVELHVVTGANVADEPGIFVHRGLSPNSPELIGLYHEADIFCLPTLGDCLPMVLSEAGAAGLPLVATDVGALREIVQDDRTGLLVEPGSVPALVTALSRLAGDAGLRRKLGDGAARLVAEQFDAGKNATRIVDSITEVIERRAARRTLPS